MTSQTEIFKPTKWRAPLPDGVAHAYPTRGRGAAVCGTANQSEQFDHPARSRCADCTKVVGS